MALTTTLPPTLGAVTCCAAVTVACLCLGLTLRLTRYHNGSQNDWWVRVAVVCGLVLTALAAVTASITRDSVDEQLIGLVSVASVFLSALGGGLVTTHILALVNRGRQGPTLPTPTGEDAADMVSSDGVSQPILPGGAWIGFFERLTATVCLLLGWPEAIAMTLAIKGVGRYPEIAKSNHGPIVAERFLLGTFVSILWAAACAGVPVMLR